MIATTRTTNGHSARRQGPPASAPAGKRKMSQHRKTSLAAQDILYVLTFVSIPTLGLYSGVRRRELHPRRRPGHRRPRRRHPPRIIVALAGMGTAVALFPPVLKRQNEGVALGFRRIADHRRNHDLRHVACLLSVVSLRQAGAGPAALVTSHALVSMYDRLFLVGQSLMPRRERRLAGLAALPRAWSHEFFPCLDLSGPRCSLQETQLFCST